MAFFATEQPPAAAGVSTPSFGLRSNSLHSFHTASLKSIPKSASISAHSLAALNSDPTVQARLAGPTQVTVTISVPSQSIRRGVRLDTREPVWNVRLLIMNKIAPDIPDALNYGLFLEGTGGKQGKFLDDMRDLASYGAEDGTVLAFIPKQRMYPLPAKELAKLNSEKAQKQFMQLLAKYSWEKMKTKCERGLDPNFWDEKGETPLTTAAQYSDPALATEAISQLVSFGAILDYRNRQWRTPLHVAAALGNVAATKRLLDLGHWVSIPSSRGHTPLYEACTEGRTECVKILLEKHSSPNVATAEDRKTPLHQAASFGYPEVVALLIQKGADIEARNNAGNTPLHVAAAKGSKACVLELLKGGANRDGLNGSGKTPAQVAAIALNDEIVEIIRGDDAIDKDNRARQVGLFSSFRRGKVPRSESSTSLLSNYSAAPKRRQRGSIPEFDPPIASSIDQSHFHSAPTLAPSSPASAKPPMPVSMRSTRVNAAQHHLSTKPTAASSGNPEKKRRPLSLSSFSEIPRSGSELSTTYRPRTPPQPQAAEYCRELTIGAEPHSAGLLLERIPKTGRALSVPGVCTSASLSAATVNNAAAERHRTRSQPTWIPAPPPACTHRTDADTPAVIALRYSTPSASKPIRHRRRLLVYSPVAGPPVPPEALKAALECPTPPPPSGKPPPRRSPSRQVCQHIGEKPRTSADEGTVRAPPACRPNSMTNPHQVQSIEVSASPASSEVSSIPNTPPPATSNAPEMLTSETSQGMTPPERHDAPSASSTSAHSRGLQEAPPLVSVEWTTEPISHGLIGSSGSLGSQRSAKRPPAPAPPVDNLEKRMEPACPDT